MSKIIKVPCPSCKQTLQLPEQQLKDNQGRADCEHCGHTFRLVKKKKAENPPEAQPKAAPKKDVFADVGVKQDPVFPTDGFPTGNAKKTSKLKKILNYREPKAGNKPDALFADANQQKPFAFNMLDAETANSQIPNVNIKPSLKNAPMVSGAGNAEQQNNITIHTDSLVFTLVGDNAQDGNVIDGGGNRNMPPVVVAPANELNWTIATMAALVVLILQLFYLVIMFQ